MIVESVNTTMLLFDCFHSVKPEIELLLQHCTICVCGKTGSVGRGRREFEIRLKQIVCFWTNRASRGEMTNRRNQFNRLFFSPQTHKQTQTHTCAAYTFSNRDIVCFSFYDEYINFKLVIKYWLFYVYLSSKIQTRCNGWVWLLRLNVHWVRVCVCVYVYVCVASYSNKQFYLLAPSLKIAPMYRVK